MKKSPTTTMPFENIEIFATKRQPLVTGKRPDAVTAAFELLEAVAGRAHDSGASVADVLAEYIADALEEDASCTLEEISVLRRIAKWPVAIDDRDLAAALKSEEARCGCHTVQRLPNVEQWIELLVASKEPPVLARERTSSVTDAFESCCAHGMLRTATWIFQQRGEVVNWEITGDTQHFFYAITRYGRISLAELVASKKRFTINDPHNVFAMAAAHYGHVAMLQFLHNCPSVNMKNHNCTLAEIAAENGHLDALTFVFDVLGYVLPDDSRFIVRKAVIGGNLEMLKYLSRQSNDRTCFVWEHAVTAVRFGHVHIISYFVEILGINFLPPLEELVNEAATNGQINVLKWLFNRMHVIDSALAHKVILSSISFRDASILQFFLELGHVDLLRNALEYATAAIKCSNLHVLQILSSLFPAIDFSIVWKKTDFYDKGNGIHVRIEWSDCPAKPRFSNAIHYRVLHFFSDKRGIAIRTSMFSELIAHGAWDTVVNFLQRPGSIPRLVADLEDFVKAAAKADASDDVMRAFRRAVDLEINQTFEHCAKRVKTSRE